MALRFFADHCISNQVMNVLWAAEHEVLRLKDRIPAESPDPVVIAKAQELGAILLSLNGDFADLVAYPPRRYQDWCRCKYAVMSRFNQRWRILAGELLPRPGCLRQWLQVREELI